MKSCKWGSPNDCSIVKWLCSTWWVREEGGGWWRGAHPAGGALHRDGRCAGGFGDTGAAHESGQFGGVGAGGVDERVVAGEFDNLRILDSVELRTGLERLRRAEVAIPEPGGDCTAGSSSEAGGAEGE